MQTFKYEFTNNVNSNKLLRELKESFMGDRLSHLNVDGDEVEVYTTEALSTQERTDLQAIVDAHVTSDPYADVETLIRAAAEYGQRLILDFSVENVMMGITQAGKTKDVLLYLRDVKSALDTGSLYAAIEEIEELRTAGLPPELAPFITDDRLQEMLDKLNDYLGS